ncbi:MAG: MBL fold metallo-hydrolase [Clostridia bacterium]|nr:MBL fold metallo-hydrolase [Clostridia bacterium]
MDVRCFPMSCNCYIVSDEQGNTVVFDPCEKGAEIYSYLETQNLKLCAVIITHAHFDHIYGLTDLVNEAEKNGRSIPVYVHKDDAAAMASERANLSGPLFCRPYRYTGILNELHDGDKVSIGTMCFEVISCPGHTPGSACFAEHSEKTLFSGDVLFEGSIGRTDFDGGDIGQMRVSLQKLMSLEDSYRVYPGHGGSTTIGEERNFNPYIASL